MFGRAGGDADIAIDDPRLSRQHVEITHAGVVDRIELRDCGSKNGTFVGAKRVERTSLQAGDVVRMGSTVAVFDEAAARDDRDPAILGRAAAFTAVLDALDRLGPTRTAVLLVGETGTGKDILARHVHQRSGRAGAFVPVDCGTIAEQGLERRFFGVAGSERGVLEAASGGTLFLDEVAALPVPVQQKLLRPLETGEYTPVGGVQPQRADLRIVASTNADPKELRPDLYARLAGYVARVPPLRERRLDILPLLRRFLEDAAPPRPVRLSPTVAERLLLHDWPMNLRELSSWAVQQATNLPESGEVTRWAEPQPARSPALPRGGPPPDELRALLREHAGSVARLAQHYGKERRQIYRWLERHSLDPDDYRKP